MQRMTVLATLALAAAAAPAHAAEGHAVPALDLPSMLFVFMLSTFIGVGVIRRVSRLLHTPLMSLTNAISSVIVVGALLAVGVDFASGPGAGWARGFGFLGLILASVNIFGGFLVTSRMLAMYQKKK